MKYRELGKTGIKISEIGLGCMGMTHAYGKPRDKGEMIEFIHHAISLGCNFFDTAVVYGEDNERILGEAVKPYRKDVVIATKFGITGQKLVDGKPVNILDSKPDSIRKQLDESLKRLDTDYIDLYYQHRVDPDVEPEEVAKVMKELIAEGKIKAWGVSNAPMDYIKRANKICPISAMENQYSFVWRKPEKEEFEFCEKENVTFVAYSPLGNGFLTGKYNIDTKYEAGDFRNTMGRFKPEVMKHNENLLNLIKEIANNKDVTPAQVTLAWELAKKPFIVPIPGSTKTERLEENLKSCDVEFTSDELERIDNALSKLNIDETHF